MNYKVTDWLNSSKYQSDLSNALDLIKRLCNASKSEATTSSAFENAIYSKITENTGIIPIFEKEEQVKIYYRHKFVAKGRLDAVVNNLVIEYKHHTKLSSPSDQKKAIEQVNRYLYSLNEKENLDYNAILTDGVRIAYFDSKNGIAAHSSFHDLTKDDLDKIIRAILSNNRRKFTASNILLDFSIKPHCQSITKTLANILFHCLLDNCAAKTEMLFSEWKKLMHLSSADDIGKSGDIEKRREDLSGIFNQSISNSTLEHKAIYALQTTYAIIVKLIACRIIDNEDLGYNNSQFTDLTNLSEDKVRGRLEMMEDGYTYKNNNIYNFLEGDFFSWYVNPEQWTRDLFSQIHCCIAAIDMYSAFSFNVSYSPIDVFKDLYMSIIPKSIRHSMGEYFTPYWLADRVVTEGLSEYSEKKWKAIDPCCGSGIFIVSLIKKIVGERDLSSMSSKERKALQNEIVSRVYGIDINPLSVLSARVGYYLALLPLGHVSNIEIPVYLGDSAIVPKTIICDDVIPCFNYSIKNEKDEIEITLPHEFVYRKDFSKIMSSFQRFINENDEDGLLSEMKLCMNVEAAPELEGKIEKLSHVLVELHKKNWDGIWIRIITNYMLIARLGDFDFIAGNPPWVKWEHLPAVYALRIKEYCDISHIFCNDGGQYGGTQLNICALIANVVVKNWLSKSGTLAFLMPDSIMSQNSYEEFRNFYVEYPDVRMYLQRIDRWVAPLRPFRYEDTAVSQDFITYYYSRTHVDYYKGIPVTEISRGKTSDVVINKSESFEEAKPYLTFKNGKAAQMTKSSTAFSYVSDKYDFSEITTEEEPIYSYRTGVEFTPQELFMLRQSEVSEIDPANNYKFTNRKFMQAKKIVEDTPNGGWDLETRYIYPIATSPEISPFKFTQSGQYCILPYKESNLKQVISPKVFKAESEAVFNYLRDHKILIDAQSNKSKDMHRGKEFYALSKIGPYTFAPFIVAARDNTNFCAAVIPRTITPWGEEKQTICVKHTIIISQTNSKKARFITEDEAYYICGILNCDIVSAYMRNTFKTNGISLKKSHLYIPEFNCNDDNHKAIVALAKEASNGNETTIISNSSKISDIYIELCRNRD